MGDEETIINLISPYSEKTGVYRGNIHCHTTESDGNKTPTEAVTFYKDLGYDFVSISDHNLTTADPGVEGILFIPGQEHTIWVHRHELFLNVGESQWVGLAHPLWEDTTYEEVESRIPYSNAIAVFNEITVPHNFEDVIDYYLTLYNEFWIYAEDDSHGYYWNNGRASIFVFSDELSLEEIMENMFNGNFYSSNMDFPDLNITVDATTVRASVDTSSTIEFITAGGTVSQTDTGVTSASYTPVWGDVYVRVRVTRDTAIAWSNPIFVRKL